MLAPGCHAGPDHLQRFLPTSAILAFCCTNAAMLWNPAPLHVGDAMDSCSYGLKPTLLQLFLHKWVNQSTWSRGRNQANWSVSSEQVLTWWPRRNVIHQSHNNALVVQCSVSKLMFVVYLQFSELIFKVHNLDVRSRSKLGWVFFFLLYFE